MKTVHIVAIIFSVLSLWIDWYYIMTHTEKQRWIWNTVYCDSWLWSTYRWIVINTKWSHLLLDQVEAKCYYHCRCDWWEKVTWLWCYEDAEYNLFEWMPIDDDLSKVWVKTDCYMTWDIDSILDYRDRNI